MDSGRGVEEGSTRREGATAVMSVLRETHGMYYRHQTPAMGSARKVFQDVDSDICSRGTELNQGDMDPVLGSFLSHITICSKPVVFLARHGLCIGRNSVRIILPRYHYHVTWKLIPFNVSTLSAPGFRLCYIIVLSNLVSRASMPLVVEYSSA